MNIMNVQYNKKRNLVWWALYRGLKSGRIDVTRLLEKLSIRVSNTRLKKMFYFPTEFRQERTINKYGYKITIILLIPPFF